jgi:hypothetical protein
VKFNCADDANGFPLQRGDLISLHFRIGSNEPGERLVGVLSSEIDKGGAEWASRDGDNQTAHLDVSAYATYGFGVFDYRSVVRPYWNHTEQQTEKYKQWTHLRNPKSGWVRNTQEHFVVPLRSSEFFSVFMGDNKFVSPSGNFGPVIRSHRA